MKKQLPHTFLLFCIAMLAIPNMILHAQGKVNFLGNQKKILLRDSADFKNKSLSINTTSNEFSPIPFQGGLIYISNKAIQNEKIAFNKIYWTNDVDFKIIDKLQIDIIRKDSSFKYIKDGKTDDYTAPTSNDNNILVRYKKKNTSTNHVEISFLNFSTDQAFAYNDSTKLLIYAKKSKKSKDGLKHWALWQSYLINGKLKQKKRIQFNVDTADYLYPYLTKDGLQLYFASNIKNGKGGYDIYYVNINGNEISTNPIAVNEINTGFDEIAPSFINDTLLFSSNRVGGIGGFDAYYMNAAFKTGIQNLGFPVNSENDEVGIKKENNEYYLTTNRNGNFDILNLQYLPITYVINGVLTYKTDGSLVPNHLLYLKDKDADFIIDTISTDQYAKYSFIGKPNRNYEFTTLNGDSLYEQFNIQTIPKHNQFDYVTYINGRSPKQKADSLNVLWAIAQKRIADSIAMYAINTKFVVHYAFDKSIISNKEKLVLDSLINKLSFLPDVFISVGAFTDCIGSYKYNYKLSVKRGKAVVDYLIKHGLDKRRIIANGYSKKYNIAPCLTKYAKNNKSIQQSSRRAEIVLSESKNTDWATLELQRGKNYYALYNSAKVSSRLLVSTNTTKDTIKKATVLSRLDIKQLALTKIVEQELAAKKLAKVVILEKEKIRSIEVANTIRIKDSINKALAITTLNFKKEQLFKAKLAQRKQDSIKVAIVMNAKLALAKKVESDNAAKKLAKEVMIEKEKIWAIEVVNTIRVKDSINKAIAIVALNVKNEQILKDKLERERQNTLAQAKVKAEMDLISKVAALKKKTKDSLAAASLKSITRKSSDIVEEDLSKEEILKSLEELAKLKLEQERIVEYLTKRINKKPIFIYVSSDSVDIEIYDNGIHDKDSVSVIYNKRLVVDRQELKINKPIKFKLKVDKDSKNNELVFVAGNLGTEPPNTGVMFITEKTGRRQQIILSTDLTHNEVIYFIRIEKKL